MPRLRRSTRRIAHGTYGLETVLIHGRPKSPKWDYSHHVVPPISASVAYRLESEHRGAKGFVDFSSPTVSHFKRAPIYLYDRLDEPTRGMLEERLAYAHRAEVAVTFASGMGAISAVFGVTMDAGDEVLAHQTLYGCTVSLFDHWFPKYRMRARYADLSDPGRLPRLLGPRTRVVHVESPTNPTLQCLEIEAIARAIRRANRGRRRPILLCVDNTFATPFGQRPLSLGADFVVESLTKDVAGFGTDMGGAVMTRREFESLLFLYRKDFGAVLSPRAAWPILVYGLPTLATRLKRQEETALAVATFLERHPKVLRVSYPGLPSYPWQRLARRQMIDYAGAFAPGHMIYFEMAGRSPRAAGSAAERLVDRIACDAYSVTLAVSLGQIRTLIEHPASMTHAALTPAEQLKAGLVPGGIRLSIGLEESGDIVRDLQKALQHA